MGFVIGFGSIEQAFEDAEEKAFIEYARQRYGDLGCCYVTPELAEDVTAWLEARAASYRDQSDEYKSAASHPDRYSDYYVHVMSDASYIVAIFRHHHINRRHALSPDGWALLQTRRLACFSSISGD